MNNQSKKQFTANKVKEEKINKITLDIVELEKEAAIVILDGWRKRVYFEDMSDVRTGQSIEIEYTGNIEDIHTVKFLKVK